MQRSHDVCKNSLTRKRLLSSRDEYAPAHPRSQPRAHLEAHRSVALIFRTRRNRKVISNFAGQPAIISVHYQLCAFCGHICSRRRETWAGETIVFVSWIRGHCCGVSVSSTSAFCWHRRERTLRTFLPFPNALHGAMALAGMYINAKFFQTDTHFKVAAQIPSCVIFPIGC